ncbi:unnamed protein product [Chrysoparadoxa australica]
MSGVPARLVEASRRIFRNLPQSKVPTGNKILRKNLKGQQLNDWYSDTIQPSASKFFPWLETDARREARAEQRVKFMRKGVRKPKKGEGKRAQQAATKGKK